MSSNALSSLYNNASPSQISNTQTPQSLDNEGKNDLALKALHKYDQEMPDIYPYAGIAQSKYWLIDTAFRLHDKTTANKYSSSADDYLTDQLNYNYHLLQSSPGDVNIQNVQFEVSALSSIASLNKQYDQPEMAAKLQAQADDYMTKFKDVMNKQ